MSCGIGHRHGSDPTLLWLWCRLVASAPIQPLAWEPPYATEAAQENGKKGPKKKKERNQSLSVRCDDEFANLTCAVSGSNANSKVLVHLSPTATGTLYSRSLTPDDDVFQYLAHTYASKNPDMKKRKPCKTKIDSPSGIVNGYFWYPLKGEFLFALLTFVLPSPRGASWFWVTPAVASLAGHSASLQLCLCLLIPQSTGRGPSVSSASAKPPSFRRLLSVHL